MKKRIFISIPSLNIGGAETALIGMLQTFDYTKVDVDLFMYSHEGPFIKFIPKDVNVLPEIPDYAMTYGKTEFDCIKAGLYRLALAMFKVRVRMKLYVIKNRPATFSALDSFRGVEIAKVLPKLDDLGQYDLAISFVDPHSYIRDHIHAKKIVGWIHTDYSYIDANRKVEIKAWSGLDKIVAISEDVRRSFISSFPELQNKITLIENIISPKFVRKRGSLIFPKEFVDYANHSIPIICSVGRVCYQKNFDCIPYVAKKLVDFGIQFKWFIIGPGDSSRIKSVAKELGVSENVIFLGPRDNPCPYIKNCLIYVQPSRYEGKSIAVREAQILCKPVVITNYPTAPSQVIDGKDGIIVPIDNDSIANGIERLIKDKNLQTSFSEYLATHDYGNEKEIEKIYSILD